MLLLACSLRELSFSKLMSVYDAGNREHGAELAPGEPEARQVALAEQDFYSYLHDSFFPTPGARYAVWDEDGSYVSALRLEPFRDGLLVEALETIPNRRRKGYASNLLSAVQKALAGQGGLRLYSHVNKKNAASLRTHLKCGFWILQDYAVYIDGSVNSRAYTMVYEREIAEKSKNGD